MSMSTEFKLLFKSDLEIFSGSSSGCKAGNIFCCAVYKPQNAGNP